MPSWGRLPFFLKTSINTNKFCVSGAQYFSWSSFSLSQKENMGARIKKKMELSNFLKREKKMVERLKNKLFV